MPIEQQHADRSSSRRTRLLSPGFSLRRHLGVFAALAGAGVATAGWLVRRARLADVWIVPAYLVVANLVEYVVHRALMHRPLWPRALYRGHTLGHHRAFHQDSMANASWRELELVMMPWLSLLAYFVVIGPFAALVAWAFGPGAAGLFLLTGVSTFVLYEGMHALYHLPPSALARLRLDRSGLFQFLYRHHRHHHRLGRMRWVNFNISCPLTDRLFGTLEDEQDWLWARERRAVDEAAADPSEAEARQRSSGVG
jgi:sterol desaturase/sphingolipid hydroxylase (fatty acid hydroxylase superfamily)